MRAAPCWNFGAGCVAVGTVALVLMQAVQLAILGIAAITFVGLMVELARRPVALVIAYLGVYAWSLLFDLPRIEVAGIGVDPVDVVNLIALGAALIRMRRGPRGWQWALLVAVALIALGTVRGLVQLGGGALLGFRLELYFVVPALFVATLPAATSLRLLRPIVLFGVGIALVAVARWALFMLGAAPGISGGGNYVIPRVIDSSTTLWVAFAGAAGSVALLDGGASFPRWKLQAGTFLTLAVVLLAQHRSVWVATAVMLATALVMTRSRWLVKAAIVVIAALGVLAIEIVGLGDAGQVGEPFAYAVSNTNTWMWRLERWANVWSIHADRGIVAVVLGSGYGYGWVTGVIGTWEASPHNGFLQIAVRIGLVGVLLVFAPYAVALRRLRRNGGVRASITWLWVIGALVFYIPYSGNMLTGVLLGIAIAASPPVTSRAGSDVAVIDHPEPIPARALVSTADRRLPTRS